MRIDVVLPQTELPGSAAEDIGCATLADRASYGRLVIYHHGPGAERGDRPTPLSGPYDDRTLFHGRWSSWAT